VVLETTDIKTTDIKESNMPRILVIDDNETVCTALDVLFSLNNIDVSIALSPEEGLEKLKDTSIGLVIQDMNFRNDTTSGEEGIKLFADIRKLQPDMPIILLTAWGDLETAVELVRSGAADYMTKPWNDDKLSITVSNLLDLHETTVIYRNNQQKHQTKKNKLQADFELCELIYESDEMHQLLSIATQIAASDVPILITGPNGSGKNKLAEIIQKNSSVCDGPFVSVNAGALPAELIEAELFGNEVGAYTGATKARQGRFETADGGTLFLDEIGTLTANGQIKLLRILESGEFERLGSSKTKKVSVRIISATNADLKQAIVDKVFREDLYYRLNVIELKVPALAERKDDIIPLACFFLKEQFELSELSNQALMLHDWPGNVRELQNAIQRAMLLCSDNIVEPIHLGLEHIALNTSNIDKPSSDISKEDIQQALSAYRNNISQVSKKLGLSRQALYRRMDKLGLKR